MKVKGAQTLFWALCFFYTLNLDNIEEVALKKVLTIAGSDHFLVIGGRQSYKER